MLKLAQRHRADFAFHLAATAAVVLAALLAGSATKPFAHHVASAAPAAFTASIMLAIAVGAATARRPRLAWTRRVAINLIVVAGVLPVAFLRAETLAGPFVRDASVETVVAQVARDENVARYLAWARINTMTRAEKDQTALAVAQLLVGPDDAARRSAALTLDVPLRRHMLAALASLAPELKAHLTAEPSDRGARAADFARHFVVDSAVSIRKALDPRNREKLPEGGLEALCLALATEETIGQPVLRQLAEHGEEAVRPLAQETLALARL